MPKTYRKCGMEVMGLVAELTDAHHVGLAEHGVSIQCLFADAGMDKAGNFIPAVKRAGVACAALVKVVGLKDRASGNADAEIVIDENVWNALEEPERRALIDHELEHLELEYGTGNEVVRDSCGRTKLKLRPHDWEVWGFESIVARHGAAALEFQAAAELYETYGQLLFAFEELPRRWNTSARGVESVTLSTAERSVTVTGEQFSKLAERMEKSGAV